tara:strand:- start:64 stop:438 length:375 start_codon:yes stop_codon:yes gene_type:complete
MNEENSSSRKYKLSFRKKLLENIKKLKSKQIISSIFKIVNRDIGNNFSENKSGIYFNLNLLSDDAIEEIVNLTNINLESTASESIDDKLIYKSYSENEIDIFNSIGPRLSNQEKSILKKCKNND